MGSTAAVVLAAALMPAYADWSATNPECLAMNEGIRHLPARRVSDPAESRSGHPHLICGPFLVEPFEIRKSYGLKFIQGHDDFLEIPHRDANWLEYRGCRSSRHQTPATWSGHSLASELIMNICS
jgi:hypothetical protein